MIHGRIQFMVIYCIMHDAYGKIGSRTVGSRHWSDLFAVGADAVIFRDEISQMPIMTMYARASP